MRIKPGDPVYITGPLDITVGTVEEVTATYIFLAPGACTTRDVVNETALVNSGTPSGTHYCVHTLGRMVPWIWVAGISPLPKFDTADWPSEG